MQFVKKGVFNILFLCIIATVNAHVCNDVVSGSQLGCPDPQTVVYVSDSSSGNRFTIVSQITAKHVQFIQGSCTCSGTEEDGCYDNEDYGNICNTGSCFTTGFTVQYFDFDVNQGNSGDLSFSSSPTRSPTGAPNPAAAVPTGSSSARTRPKERRSSTRSTPRRAG